MAAPHVTRHGGKAFLNWISLAESDPAGPFNRRRPPTDGSGHGRVGPRYKLTDGPSTSSSISQQLAKPTAGRDLGPPFSGFGQTCWG
jgi:hypothetical protein